MRFAADNFEWTIRRGESNLERVNNPDRLQKRRT